VYTHHGDVFLQGTLRSGYVDIKTRYPEDRVVQLTGRWSFEWLQRSARHPCEGIDSQDTFVFEHLSLPVYNALAQQSCDVRAISYISEDSQTCNFQRIRPLTVREDGRSTTIVDYLRLS